MNSNLVLLLEEEMRRRGLSTRDVGEETGVAHTTIGRILKGRPVNVKTLERVAQFLKADPADLLPGANDDLAKSIAALIAQEPALAEALQKAAEKVKEGGMAPEVLREIIRYAAWRINDIDNANIAKGGDVKGQARHQD